MPTFQLICIDGFQKRTQLTLKAEDEAGARQQAEKRRLSTITCAMIAGDRISGSASSSKKPLNTAQLASFCGRLAPLLEMNIPTRAALGFLADNSPDPLVRKVSGLIRDKMENMSLSDALKSTKQFPPMLEGIVQVGSDSSDLSEPLATMARFYSMIITMQSGIRNALIQPGIAFAVLVGFLFFSLFFTIPQISRLLDGLGTKPGWLISSVFALTQFLTAYWPIFMAILGLGLYLLFFDNPLRRAFAELLIKRWGAFRGVYHNMRQTALLYALAILVKAQIPQGQIFKYLMDVTRDTPLEKQIKVAAEFHAKDGRFTKAIEKHVELDPEIVFTLRVGEETSTLHLQAEKMALVYEKMSLQASEALGIKIAPVVIILTALMAAGLFGLTFGSIISVCIKLIRGGG